PRKPAQESRPNRPSILPAQAARFVERTTGDGLSLLGPQLPESGIPLGDCQLRSHVFAPPPPGLPVAFALRRRRLYYLRTRRNVESRSPLSLPGVEPFWFPGAESSIQVCGARTPLRPLAGSMGCAL